MKKLFYIITFLIFLTYNFTNKSFAESDLPYSLKGGYNLYLERVDNICEPYRPKKELLKIIDEYNEIEGPYGLNSIKNKHKKNMNNIYNCALVNIQKKSLLLIKNDLTKKNPILLERVWKKIDKKIHKLEITFKTLKCNNIEDKTSILKLNLLQQTTYQTCIYISYLEYLREHSNKIESIVPWDNKKSYSTSEIIFMNNKQLNEIDEEIEHTYKVFPMAFHALTEYENNITIHFLLELIKDDYIIFREKLHKVLNPINQVVYKISNAMRK